MSKDEECRNCKYHYIEELSFDYPQSCCSKRNAVIEAWFNCSEFEYSESYINELQQENQQLKDNRDKLREFLLEEGFEINTREYGSLDVVDKSVILDKMKELEGSDHNERL